MLVGLQIGSRGSLVFQIVKFLTLQCGGIPYVGGTLEPLEAKEACHTQNCQVSSKYCINGLYIAAFGTFQISNKIAVIDISDNAGAKLRAGDPST
jgi:hypothetical protein